MDQNGALRRSVTSFRRQGSSGVVWDDKYLVHNKDSIDLRELRPSQSVGSIGMMQRSHSTRVVGGVGGGGGSGSGSVNGGGVYRTVKVAPPLNADPPSPRVSGCGLCGIFGKPNASK